MGEGEVELVVAVTGGGCDKEGVSRVKWRSFVGESRNNIVLLYKK